MIDLAAIRPVELPASAVGASLSAIAHGIGDSAPLPTAQRLLTGENLRPPAPCHLKVSRAGADIQIQWTRRSHRGWAWSDGVGVADDPFPELYRVTVTGPAGQLVAEVAEARTSFGATELPAGPGETIAVGVAMVGSMAMSRETTATFVI